MELATLVAAVQKSDMGNGVLLRRGACLQDRTSEVTCRCLHRRAEARESKSRMQTV